MHVCVQREADGWMWDLHWVHSVNVWEKSFGLSWSCEDFSGVLREIWLSGMCAYLCIHSEIREGSSWELLLLLLPLESYTQSLSKCFGLFALLALRLCLPLWLIIYTCRRFMLHFHGTKCPYFSFLQLPLPPSLSVSCTPLYWPEMSSFFCIPRLFFLIF